VSDIAALRSRCAQLEAQLAEAEAANLLLRGVALDGVEAVRAALATTPAAPAAALARCRYCATGFPLRDDGFHYGCQRLGMIPDARCEADPAPVASLDAPADAPTYTARDVEAIASLAVAAVSSATASSDAPAAPISPGAWFLPAEACEPSDAPKSARRERPRLRDDEELHAKCLALYEDKNDMHGEAAAITAVLDAVDEYLGRTVAAPKSAHAPATPPADEVCDKCGGPGPIAEAYGPPINGGFCAKCAATPPIGARQAELLRRLRSEVAEADASDAAPIGAVELLHAAAGYSALGCKRWPGGGEHSDLCMALQVMVTRDRSLTVETCAVEAEAACDDVHGVLHGASGCAIAARIRALASAPLGPTTKGGE
jgi:hypothetical protein